MKGDRRRPTIHLYIRGNCGNQFFQYAFARSLQERVNGNLVINYFRVREDKTVLPGSDNLLQQFNTVPYRYENAPGSGGFIFRFLKLIHICFKLDTFQTRTYRFYLWCAKNLPRFGIYYFDAAYYPFKIFSRRNYYINGYFESPRYFSDIDDKICEELQPISNPSNDNQSFYKDILENESVCVTIKRMDVNNKSIADIYQYDISYFYRAMDYIFERVDNPVFFIFSDDIQWCRDNIRTSYKLRFENEGNSMGDKVQLMSSCKHFIIHNSTFSWWMQHLSQNPNKIVIAPSIWMLRDDQPIDIYENNWTYISPNGTIMSKHE